MNKICTSIEQSKKLIELGIDVDTADMFWKNGVSDKYIQCFTPFVSDGLNIDFDYDIPAWSLSALLELMPKIIFVNGRTCRLIFEVSPHTTKDKLSTKVTYLCLRTGADYGHIINNNSCLDAAFEMVCWLKENGKI